MEKFLSKIKDHPYITAGIALVGGVILYTAFFSGGSSSSGPSQGQVDAQNFATQTQGATNLAVAQAAQQAAQFQTQAQEDVANNYISAQKDIASQQIQAQTNANVLQAGALNSLISGSIQTSEDTNKTALQIATLQQNVAMEGLAIANNVQGNGFDSPYGAEFSGYGLSFHVTGSAPQNPISSPPPPPPPAPPPPANNSLVSGASGGGGLIFPSVANNGILNGQFGQWLSFSNGAQIFEPTGSGSFGFAPLASTGAQDLGGH